MSFLLRFWAMVSASDRDAAPDRQAYADGFHICAGLATTLAHPAAGLAYLAGLSAVQLAGTLDRDGRLDILAGVAGCASAWLVGGPAALVVALAAWLGFAWLRGV